MVVSVVVVILIGFRSCGRYCSRRIGQNDCELYAEEAEMINVKKSINNCKTCYLNQVMLLTTSSDFGKCNASASDCRRHFRERAQATNDDSSFGDFYWRAQGSVADTSRSRHRLLIASSATFLRGGAQCSERFDRND